MIQVATSRAAPPGATSEAIPAPDLGAVRQGLSVAFVRAVLGLAGTCADEGDAPPEVPLGGVAPG